MARLSKAVLLVGLASHTLATAKLPRVEDGKTMAFDEIFDVNFDTDKDGGCKSYKEKIETAYVETIAMSNAALSAIDWLSGITKTPTKPDGDNYEKYLRIRQMYMKMFNLDPMGMDGAGLAGETGEVMMTYNEYLDAHETSSTNPTTKFYIRCGDEWLKWAKATDPDPREGKQSTPPKYTLAKPKPPNPPAPKGAYYAPGFPPINSVLRLGDKEVKHPACDEDTMSITFAEASLLIFCPALFKGSRTGKLQIKKDAWSIDSVKLSAEKSMLKKPTHLDAVESTIALNWLHQLGHLVKDFPDPKAINAGKDKNGHVRRVYGWDSIVNYAKEEPEKVHKSPDNLAYFAAAMYWKEFFWASGTAKTTAEAVTGGSGGTGAGRSKRSRVMGQVLDVMEE